MYLEVALVKITHRHDMVALGTLLEKVQALQAPGAGQTGLTTRKTSAGAATGSAPATGSPAQKRVTEKMDAYLAEAVPPANEQAAAPEKAAPQPAGGKRLSLKMIEEMWPGGEEPVTGKPTLEILDDGDALRIRLSATTPGASLGYRLDGGSWKLYAGPFPASKGQRIEARAVRYGWSASPSVRARP